MKTNEFSSFTFTSLDEHHARALRQSDIGTQDEIDSWYSTRVGALAPRTGTRLGFETQREFLDELNFEYFYSQLGKTQE